jgi:hypothetical protein
MAINNPINQDDPCNAKGGWFYVNPRSIDVVTENADIVRVTRQQLLAALQLMEASP